MKPLHLSWLLLAITACHKIQSYPDTPVVHFKEFNYRDTSLVFTFVDGDGDVGFDSDTVSINDTTDSAYNVFAPLEICREGRFSPFSELKYWRYRIADIPVPQGQNKTLKGEIKLRFHYLFGDSATLHMLTDTFRFVFWMNDKAFHRSNTDSTPPLLKSRIGK